MMTVNTAPRKSEDMQHGLIKSQIKLIDSLTMSNFDLTAQLQELELLEAKNEESNNILQLRFNEIELQNKRLLELYPGRCVEIWEENKQILHHLDEFAIKTFEYRKLQIFGKQTEILTSIKSTNFPFECPKKFLGTPSELTKIIVRYTQSTILAIKLGYKSGFESKEFGHYKYLPIGKTKEFDVTDIIISRVGLKVFSSNNWNEQSYHGIKIYGENDQLVHDVDFSSETESSVRAIYDAKWVSQFIPLGDVMIGFYGQIWYDGFIRRMGLVTVKRK